MTKDEIAVEVAKQCGLYKKEAEYAIELILKTLKAELADGGPVVIRGFGTFSTWDKQARNGRNPKTGQPVVIRARRVATFKPGRYLKQAVNS